MTREKRPNKTRSKPVQSSSYKHPEATNLMRPEVGTQAQFKKKKPPKIYRYDSSLSPTLDWDAKNPAREQGEALIKQVLDAKGLEEAKAAASKLKALSKPFLNWAGKAERLSFDVPTLPLFIHERLSTKAIIETLAGHKRDQQQSMFDLFGDPQHSITDQVLRAYEHRDRWVNRLILGDSLVVMNSLLHYEGLGGLVQMIYMDPPYGVKFGSNFQPFVRKRDVSHNDDEDMTREPEMVQAYRDTWELGLHSYLTYLRDRLLLARDLLAPSGSVFVQISDENLHHVREVMDEVLGPENIMSVIAFRTKIPLNPLHLANVSDYLLWYAKDKTLVKFRRLYEKRLGGAEGDFQNVELASGERRSLMHAEREGALQLPSGSRLFVSLDLSASGYTASCDFPVKFEGKTYKPTVGKAWKTNPEGMNRLLANRRVHATGNALRYVFYESDYPVKELTNVWTDTLGEAGRIYVVQTPVKAIARCILMTTDPGDLLLDPTCGSGTTAYIAESWGRRWITIDTSRVPLALARQRLLTATFPWYELKDEARGPVGGFVYKRKQNKKGEEIGGIVPHITLGSIAQNEPPAQEVVVDRPEEVNGITRVTGPFCVEATIPTPVDWEGDGVEDSGAMSAEAHGFYVDRMLEVLRKSPVLRLEGNKTVIFKNVRPPAKTLSLSAEALITNGGDKPVAFIFGPENGAISTKLVENAAREAHGKSYTHLYVIGFAIEAKARETVEHCEGVFGIPTTYVQATPDLMMGDLLKNMRSSQIFSVCGLPEVRLQRLKDKKYQVELLGLDVFDPVTMEVSHRNGDDVPAWFLDTNYNDLCFHVSQAFFPRTSAWDNLRKILKSEYEESVWDHLGGTLSAPFDSGEHQQIAVKVIDNRGNELLVVKKLV